LPCDKGRRLLVRVTVQFEVHPKLMELPNIIVKEKKSRSRRWQRIVACGVERHNGLDSQTFSSQWKTHQETFHP
jgi:hypothetical protein